MQQKYELLEADNEALQLKYDTLVKLSNKEDRVAVRADERVKEANRLMGLQREVIKKIRKEKEDLIIQVVKLRSERDENIGK